MRKLAIAFTFIVVSLAMVLIVFWSAISRENADVCPMVRPQDRPFFPPEPLPAKVPYEGQFWYGTADLWTTLPENGVWSGLPKHETGYTQKLVFWRLGYDYREEPEPQLTVSGRRLDGDARPLVAYEATNGYLPELDSFMLVGVDFPTTGCWEITAHYNDYELTFVVWVEI